MNLTSASMQTSGLANAYANNIKKDTKLSEDKRQSKKAANDSYETTKSTASFKEIEATTVRQAEQQIKNFQKLITNTFSKQAKKSNFAENLLKNISNIPKGATNLKDVFSGLEIDEETAAKARELISEDGYYGINQTAERILSYAKAYAGDDQKKIEEMRASVEKAFSNVEKMWGGELPEISQKTYSKIMQTFDTWQQLN